MSQYIHRYIYFQLLTFFIILPITKTNITDRLIEPLCLMYMSILRLRIPHLIVLRFGISIKAKNYWSNAIIRFLFHAVFKSITNVCLVKVLVESIKHRLTGILYYFICLDIFII